MNAAAPQIVDTLAALASPETQRLAARLAQEVFAGTFRRSLGDATAGDGEVMAEVERRCSDWCAEAADDDGRALRLALLVSGLDQWGLAYSQAFGLNAIPALSALLGALRNRLDSRGEARFQWYFGQIDGVEADAIDFKIELRRQIHLALWHAMAACDAAAEAEPLVRALGSLLLALNERLPTLGWRLVADALASIQMRLINDTAASAVARDGTQQLFAALRSALPAERFQTIMAHSTQAVLAWQQARRTVN